MATVVSAKINVMKSVIPTIKKCLLPSGRPGDSAAAAVPGLVNSCCDEDSLIQAGGRFVDSG
jgi:hypothetical protein